MDKQLLLALDNLSVGLEKLAEALEKKESKTGTGQALEAGNFGKSLEAINTQLKSIKTDTQEILKNQQTIIALSKKKSNDSGRKTEEVEDAGGGKKEGAIKKGVTTILLIAVAVLAIGMAFKLVGKINFLSVIGLSAAIWVMSLAFERIARLNLTIKQAAVASLTMVMMSTGVTISSWILSKVSKVSFGQLLTAGAIILMFGLSANKLSMMIQNLGGMRIISLLKGIVALPIVMVAVAYGITKASHILKGVTPIGFMQALTAIFIAGVFLVISYGLPKLIEAVGKISIWNVLTGKAPKIALVMAAVALGITGASHAMKSITPIGFSQAMTAILIAAMFTVISYGIVNITKALGKVTYKDMLLLPTMLTLMAIGIAASAYIFFKAKPYIDGIGFLTSLRILLLGVTIGAIAIVMAFAMKIMGKVSWKQVLQLPSLYTLLSTAIAVSAVILAKAKPSLDQLGFMTIIKILLLGVAIGIVTIVVAFTAKIMGKMSWGQVAKIPAFYTLIATAIAASAFILSKAKSSFDKMSFAMLIKLAVFGIVVAIAVAAMGLVIKFFKMLGIGVKDAVKGGIAIVAIATVIMVSSLILNVGKYKNYPSLKWAMGVGLSLGAFGVGALALGSAVFGPQALVFLAGLAAILLVAATVVGTSMILNTGNYKKYPGLGWILGVGATMSGFAAGAILLGFNALNPFFYAGLGILLLVAKSVVEVADILKDGKYNLPGLGTWAASVALLFTIFTPLIITLGAVGLAAAVVEFFGGGNPFESGRKMLKDIAWSIVDVSKILQKGTYTGGPTKAWAQGVSIALGAFAPVYKMLVDSAIFDAFGMGGVGPDEFAKAIKTVAKGITVAALYFAQNKSAFLNGPPVKWAKGVSLAIGGFAPVFKVMENFPFTGGQKIARAMVHVARAIVEVAETLSKSGGEGKFKKGTYPSKKWGEGVGAAITAFAPAFDYMFENSSGWFDDDAGEVIDQMRYGMVQIAYAIVDVANALNGGGPYTSFPTKQWGLGIQQGIKSFLDIFNMIWDSGLSTYAFRDLSSRVADGARSMAMTAAVLYYNRKAFSVKLDPNFIKNISKNIIGFAKLAVQLDKMLVSEKTITTTSSGFLGMGGSTSTQKVKERRDLGLVKDVVLQMSSVAYILWKSKKFFSFKISPDWIGNLSKNLLGYAGLQKKLESGGGLKSGLMMGLTALNPAAGLLFAGASALIESNSDDAVTKAAKKLVKVANILYSGRKAFELKLDPFFMRKIGQNLLDFNFVIKKLAEQETKGTTFMGRMGSSISGLFGNDPVSQIAHRMMTLAKGYDAIARSLIKLGSALKLLNIKNLSQLGALTKGLAGTGQIPGEQGGVRPAPVKAYGWSATKDTRSTGGPQVKQKIIPADKQRKNEIYYVSEQLEKVVKILTAIHYSTSSIDEFIGVQMKNQFMAPPPIIT
jgi:hypothetical protein